MSFDVRLPNAQIITNVPDGTTKAQLKEKLDNSSIISSWENNQSTFTGEESKVVFHGGPKALLYSESDVKKYDRMLEEGADKLDAYYDTNIVETPTGLKRFDMDVTKATLKKQILRQSEYKTTVGEILDHPTLYKNYPWLKDMPFWVVNNDTDYQGAYFPGSPVWKERYGGDTIASGETGPVRIEYQTSNINNTTDVLRTVIEEVQHLLDDYEDDRTYTEKGGGTPTEVNAESLQYQYDVYKNSGKNKTRIPPYFVNGNVDAKKFEEQFVYEGGVNDRPFLGLYYVKTDKDKGIKNVFTDNYINILNESVANIYQQNRNLSSEDFTKLLNKTYQLEDLLDLSYDPETGKLKNVVKKKEDSNVQEEPSQVDVIEEAYQNFKRAEVGDLEGFIRTNHAPEEGSSAYGPVQMTRDLVADMVNNNHIKLPDDLKDYTKRFIQQGNNFLKYGKEPNKPGYDKKYEYGEAGDLTSAQDKKDYKRLAKLIIKYHYDLVDGDTDKLINAWRFGRFDKSQDAKRDDERYYNTYTNTIVNRKTGVRSGNE
jgi:hypothetical protein